MFNVYCKRINKTKVFEVCFQYDVELIGKIKNLPKKERKYIKENKTWAITSDSLYDLIKSYKGVNTIFFEFLNGERDIFLELVKKEKSKKCEIDDLRNELEKQKKCWLEYKSNISSYVEENKPKLERYLKEGTKLKDYQVESILYSILVKKLILALDMGCGKTITSITVCECLGLNRILVITPNDLKRNYGDEINKFTNSKYYIFGSKNNIYTPEESKYIIINYDFFRNKKYSEIILKLKKNNLLLKFDGIICDECHKLKNTKANRTINFSKLIHDKKLKLFDDIDNTPKFFLSGTPAQNRAYELYNILNLICPLEFYSKQEFNSEYCGVNYDWKEGRNVFDPSLVKHEELNKKISPFIFRKLKSEVLSDLPEKTIQHVILELSDADRKEYDEIVKNTVETYLGTYKEKNPLTVYKDLRFFLNKKKANYILDVIESVYDNNEKIIVTGEYKEALYDLNKLIGNTSVVYSGDIKKIDDRDKIIKDFMNPDSNLKTLLGINTVIAEGLTLTVANKMIIPIPPFVPGILDQLSNRIHRIGQKNNVLILLPLFSNTLDIEVINNTYDKERELMMVIDGKGSDEIGEKTFTDELQHEQYFNYLINYISNKNGKKK